MDMETKRNKKKRTLKEEISRLKQRINDLEKELDTVDCEHEWTEPVYSPIRHPGYRDPGDPPGTMGVDRRLPSYIPPVEIPRWTRKCLKCKTQQETEKVTVETKTSKTPEFSDF